MKQSILIMLAAAMPVFAQGPAPVAAPAPAAPAVVVDVDKDGKISTAEAHAAKKNFMRANAHRFAKPGMNKQGRRPMGPKMGKFGPKAPKFNKEGRRHGKPGMHKQGRRPMGHKMGNFGPKAPKFNMNKQGRRPMGRQMGNFGPKAPKFNMHKKGFAPKCNGCKCGKKHAPAFRVKRMPAA